MFHFKQFSVDQSGCAMKINTDGVLLGAMANVVNPERILDIGTGTGVIAMMLAQRFTNAQIDAVEVDEAASQTAERNFKNSPFADRLAVYPLRFEDYFAQFPEKKYDLIVSNPPFYVGSLKSPKAKITLAKHTDTEFFERLLKSASDHLNNDGEFWLILPVALNETVINFSAGNKLYPKRMIDVQSYPHSEAHRVIISVGFDTYLIEQDKLLIYKVINEYTDEYKQLLTPYFTIF